MNTNEGINAGLQIWLIFLILFALLGYSALMSLIMSAIAGLAGGYIIYWLRGTFPTDDLTSASNTNNDLITRARARLNRFGWNKSEAEEGEEKSEERKKDTVPWVSRFRRRKPRRSFRSRR
jgi:uncharacterized membrane protein YuzA (DUF378 family)